MSTSEIISENPKLKSHVLGIGKKSLMPFAVWYNNVMADIRQKLGFLASPPGFLDLDAGLYESVEHIARYMLGHPKVRTKTFPIRELQEFLQKNCFQSADLAFKNSLSVVQMLSGESLGCQLLQMKFLYINEDGMLLSLTQKQSEDAMQNNEFDLWGEKITEAQSKITIGFVVNIPEELK